MNILILGSNGFIGKNLHTHLKLKKKKSFFYNKKNIQKRF